MMKNTHVVFVFYLYLHFFMKLKIIIICTYLLDVKLVLLGDYYTVDQIELKLFQF